VLSSSSVVGSGTGAETGVLAKVNLSSTTPYKLVEKLVEAQANCSSPHKCQLEEWHASLDVVLPVSGHFPIEHKWRIETRSPPGGAFRCWRQHDRRRIESKRPDEPTAWKWRSVDVRVEHVSERK
jgi:hypothetical protein